MTPLLSFYFQVHQPYRLRDLRITEIGKEGVRYFDEENNHAIFRKVAEKCYLPANALMLTLLHKHPDFRASYSLSGVFLDQCEEYGEDVLASFQALASTGKVEFLAETHEHSLSSLISLPEFCAQVRAHSMRIKELFGIKPRIFRNTELVYSNEIAQIIRLMGFRGILAEGADHVLAGRSPNVPYAPPSFDLPIEQQHIIKALRIARPVNDIAVLLKNYRLADDIAFRFSDHSWMGHPLTAERFTQWATASGGHSVNLYMDYETFGEHQWEDTGIFHFLNALPEHWKSAGGSFATPSEVIKIWGKTPREIIDAHAHISWADIERDLSAWRGNQIQEAAFNALYELESHVKAANDDALLSDWRRLQTSDHFYYMCTKYWADGDVHKYFSPYDSPYEAYRRFSHALEDLRYRIGTTRSPLNNA